MASRPGFNSRVYHGDAYLGEATYFATKSQAFLFPNHEIRISYLSPPSDRCPPLSVLHTISPFSVPCKIRANATSRESPLSRLYCACYNEGKTAVVVLGDREFHMVAMPSKTEKQPCFWCCSVPQGMYNSCLAMLNLRCLSIVFDLDETLFVANTKKSFDDKIEALSHRIDAENNPIKVAGMSSELKRYIEDREMLKQYSETDTVVDNGRLMVVQREPVPPLPGSHDIIFRPVIRLQEKGIVLTRINPEIRDTSVFVRLRPAWEELRSYLTAKGRKRFEVFVCTMAERDYALEMWRLLDPEAHLINSKQLLDRIKCVRAGSRKSLQHVFQDGICHPKMAMVIDDRILVWDDMDQPRVHVVPPFAPYYAPQAEIVAAVPVLCIARNVACNVRGGYFKEFDENLLRKIFELCYENDVLDLPYAPDVSDYLMSEDAGIQLNNNRDVPLQDTCATGVEVGKKSNIVENLGDGPKNPSQAKPNHALSDDDMRLKQLSTNNGDLHNDARSLTLLPSSIFIAVLEEIGRRCSCKVEFRAIIGSNKDFHFHFEVLFSSERIGLGMGKTKKEAQLLAAENALQNLASNYASYIAPYADGVDRELMNLSLERQNGFLEPIVTPALDESSKKELPSVDTMEQRSLSEDPERLPSVISSIKELCAESQDIVFVDQVPASVTLNKGEYYYQVELAGQILGQGVGVSRGEAKLQAAEDVLRNLKAASGSLAQKRLNSPRLTVPPTKRPKDGDVQEPRNKD